MSEQEANRNDTEALPLFISPLESQACAMCRHTMIPTADGKTLTVQFSCNELFEVFFMSADDVVEAWKHHRCAAKVLVSFVFQTDQVSRRAKEDIWMETQSIRRHPSFCVLTCT